MNGNAAETTRQVPVDVDVSCLPEVQILLMADGEAISYTDTQVEHLILPALKAIAEGKNVAYHVCDHDHQYEDRRIVIRPRLRPGIRERAREAWRAVEALRLELGLECSRLLPLGN